MACFNDPQSVCLIELVIFGAHREGDRLIYLRLQFNSSKHEMSRGTQIRN